MDLGIPSSPKRKVSLTPLIDVVFILLLFFMLASSFIEWREIDLNIAGKNSVTQQKNNTPMIVRVTHDGLMLQGKHIDKQIFAQEISASLKANPALAVVVQPQASVPLQQIVSLLDQIREQGVKSVSFLRDSKGDL